MLPAATTPKEKKVMFQCESSLIEASLGAPLTPQRWSSLLQGAHELIVLKEMTWPI